MREMVQWHPREKLPEQLGDAFAALYDWFKPLHAADADNGLWLDELPDSDEFRWLKMIVEHSGEKTPDAMRRYIDGNHAEGGDTDVAWAVYVSLCAIDRGTARQNPLESDGSALGANLGLLRHYLRHFRYNTDATDGFVLPKWTGSRFRSSLSVFEDHFVNLVRCAVDRDYVRLLGRSGSGARRRRRGEVENPSVVIVPTLYEFFSTDDVTGEASFSEVTVQGRPCFAVEHNPSALEGLRARVEESVRAIHKSGATIAIFPELVLNQDLMDTLRTNLLTESREKDHRGSQLEWVIAGAGFSTGGGAKWPMVNRCYVLNRYGEIVNVRIGGSERHWIQEKRYRYRLSRDEQEMYGVGGCFAELLDRDEAIQRGKHLYVFEDRGRRFAVLICEDLAEEEETLALAREMLCSVVVTIVMDGPVGDRRWHGGRSLNFATRTGGLTIVANSLLLPNLPKVREDWKDASYPHGEKPVGLMFIPTPGSEPMLEEIRARATPALGDWEALLSRPNKEIPLLRS
jgi:predicted amidohydrolase